MDFDPYYQWLGIPPAESAGGGPNYYRLLGLSLLEENADAISNAADRVMSHLRTFQTGKNAALSQKLLGEVAQAHICLLDPQKKAAYDSTLLAGFALPEGASQAMGPAPSLPDPAVTIRAPVRPQRMNAMRKRKSRWLELALALIGLAVLIGSAAAFAYLWRAPAGAVEQNHSAMPVPLRDSPRPEGRSRLTAPSDRSSRRNSRRTSDRRLPAMQLTIHQRKSPKNRLRKRRSRRKSLLRAEGKGKNRRIAGNIGRQPSRRVLNGPSN